jgi:hypothetical protein
MNTGKTMFAQIMEFAMDELYPHQQDQVGQEAAGRRRTTQGLGVSIPMLYRWVPASAHA